MKTNRLVLLFLLLSSATAFQLEAQQTKADHKPLQEIRAKTEAGENFFPPIPDDSCPPASDLCSPISWL
jgi:hypothetical protein